jgi:outer membrane protein assembly factor BamC
VDVEAEKNQPGFFARMFGAKPKDTLFKYQVLLTALAQQTRVQVADAKGQVIHTAEAKKILTVLADDLK